MYKTAISTGAGFLPTVAVILDNGDLLWIQVLRRLVDSRRQVKLAMKTVKAQEPAHDSHKVETHNFVIYCWRLKWLNQRLCSIKWLLTLCMLCAEVATKPVSNVSIANQRCKIHTAKMLFLMLCSFRFPNRYRQSQTVVIFVTPSKERNPKALQVLEIRQKVPLRRCICRCHWNAFETFLCFGRLWSWRPTRCRALREVVKVERWLEC